MQIPKGGIAFFDSGIGGLTVLAECEKHLSDSVFYYYGDNSHAPYGNLSPKKIRKYVFRAFKKFRRLNVRAVVIACNTATAVCVEELRARYSFPIIGAEPAVCMAAAKGGKVLVLATKATCGSKRFQKLCQQAKVLFPQSEISICPCEHLAEEIERNINIEGYDFTPHLPDVRADAVVLGCTHYIYIVEQIKRHFGCPVYDGNEGIARRLVSILKEEDGKNLVNDKVGLKGRDGRPPGGIFDAKMGLLTTERAVERNCQKITNKRSQKMPQKSIKKASLPTVFFLGKQRLFNKNIHEQMFVWLRRV